MGKAKKHIPVKDDSSEEQGFSEDDEDYKKKPMKSAQKKVEQKTTQRKSKKQMELEEDFKVSSQELKSLDKEDSEEDKYNQDEEEDDDEVLSGIESDEFSGKKKKSQKTKSKKGVDSKRGGSKQQNKKVVQKKQGSQKEKQVEDVLMDDDQFQNDGKILFTEHDIEWPYFLEPENIRDSQKRFKKDPNYDPRTLFIEQEFLVRETPVFRQYFEAKMKNFQAVLLFRFGRNFMCFYHDAFILQKLCNYTVRMWGRRPYVTVWDSQLSLLKKNLIKNGYDIAICDQIEFGSDKQEEVIKREVTQIITAGTYVDYQDNEDTTERWTLFIIESASENLIGVCAVESQQYKVFIDEFKEDEQKTNLRTIVQTLMPVEVIGVRGNLTDSSEKMIKQICRPKIHKIEYEWMTVRESLQNLKELFQEYQVPEIVQQIQEIFEDENSRYQTEQKSNRKEIKNKKTNEDYSKNPEETNAQGTQDEEETQELNSDFQYYMLIQCLMMALQQYQSIYNQEILVYSEYKFLDTTSCKKKFLYLDAYALENLDIIMANHVTHKSEKGSLLDYVNKCGSQFGKRLLKSLILKPLVDGDKIRSRQMIVSDLMTCIDEVKQFQQKLSKLPDLEKQLGNIFSSLQASRLNSTSFDNFPMQKLTEIQRILTQMGGIEQIFDILRSQREEFQSQDLINLLSFQDENDDSKQKEEENPFSEKKNLTPFQNYLKIQNERNQKKKKGRGKQQKKVGLIPRVSEIIEEINSMILKEGQMIVPRDGVSEEYDEKKGELEQKKEELDEILKFWRKKLNCQEIQFNHSRYRYQLEVPNSFVEGSKKPKEFTLISKTTKSQRFYTPQIEEIIKDIQILDQEIAKTLIPFLKIIVKKFLLYRNQWFQITSVLAQLDAFCSLALTAEYMREKEQKYCIPEIQSSKENNFQLKDMVHPCLDKNGVTMVPNDTVFSEGVNTLLVTGPNMGGKSTLLRQTCLAAILAQIGSFVPASYFSLAPIDRIFVRIGASDKPLEGKSTFFIEMEETKVICEESTENSLVLIDELGRGTSTFDGMAIAYGVLRYLVENKRCKVLFSTHYHLLLDEFKLFNQVENYVMRYQFDSVSKRITFFYKFEKGQADRSFGVNVAKIANIPQEIIQIAEIKENEMNSESQQLGKVKITTQNFNNLIQQFFLEDYDADQILKSFTKLKL